MSKTAGIANQVLDFQTGNTPVAPTTPLQVALVTANGDDNTAGTEVTGGGYARQDVGFPAASSESTSNSATVRFDNMPAVTVTGFEVWDQAATPVRVRWEAFTSNVTFNSGDAAEFAAGALTLTED